MSILQRKNIKYYYMKNRLSQKIISSLFVTLMMAGVFTFIPRRVEAVSNTMSFKGLPSVLLNCTGATKAVGKALASLTGKATSVVTKEVPVESASVTAREDCSKAIGRYIGKQMMDKITQDTINWINTGFKGEPMFVKDPESMFRSLANQEVAGFAGLIAGNPLGYPFGKDAAKNLINSYRRTFEQNAQFSLNQYVTTGNYKDFYTDFRTGGWGAWNAMVLFPQNNPVGFNLMAQDHMVAKTYNPDKGNPILNLQKQIQASGGFIDQKKCVKSKATDNRPYVPPFNGETDVDLELAGHEADANQDGLINPHQDPAPVGNFGYTLDEEYSQTALSHICGKWVTITPGSAISSQLTDALGTPLKSIGLADDLNKSLAAIFDALLNQVATKGLSELTKLTNPQVVTHYGGQGNQGDTSLDSLYNSLNNNNTNTWNTFGQKINLYDLLIAGDPDNTAPDQTGLEGQTLIDTQQKWINLTDPCTK